ncbi:cytoplasmic polyadenylation element-binding protein 3 isoform X2 [Jatropha curcas]|uniref:cytoplasmic polyadenylation element-binding protein 3 isoform X2 n=1 Tax=Jatropha curcas TaxID=180498 RepID=UPI0009D77911|nr:cytoplasmic polyadenylation element-binding protein 3 isoform X2 [Jatropha curcas]
MNRALVSIAKRAATKVNNSTSPSPNSKLFVAGLSWSVDEKSLKDAFSSFGEVTEDRDNGKQNNLASNSDKKYSHFFLLLQLELHMIKLVADQEALVLSILQKKMKLYLQKMPWMGRHC